MLTRVCLIFVNTLHICLTSQQWLHKHKFLFKACRMAPVGRPLIGHLLEVEDSYAVMLYAPSPDVICYPSVRFLSLFFLILLLKKREQRGNKLLLFSFWDSRKLCQFSCWMYYWILNRSRGLLLIAKLVRVVVERARYIWSRYLQNYWLLIRKKRELLIRQPVGRLVG